MYALPNKTQHKLIVKVRGGISQKLDNFTSSSTNSSSSSSSSTTTSSSSNNFSSSYSNSKYSSSLSSPNETSSTTSPFVSASFLGQSCSLNDSNKLDAQLNQAPQPIFHSISNHHGNKHGKAQKQQYITPEHNEMIKYVQQSWKGVERDYKKSVNNYINNIDINSSDHISSSSSHGGLMKQNKQQHQQAKKKTATTSTPLLLTGSYHHTSSEAGTKDSSNSNTKDAFRPFDLETFWGNRILKRLTEEI